MADGPGSDLHHEYGQTERLGQGAFGEVFRGRHPILDIDVAVKLVSPAKSESGAVEQLLNEARLMARLDHPNVLRVFDARRTAGGMCLVLELMDGGSCAGLRNLPGSEALAFTMQLLSGLQALHDAQVLHRDLKPANCLARTADRRIKIGDLGIAVAWNEDEAKLLRFAGTIPFMAPEIGSDRARLFPSPEATTAS